MIDWQPIETAPPEGPERVGILLFYPPHPQYPETLPEFIAYRRHYTASCKCDPPETWLPTFWAEVQPPAAKPTA